MAFYTGFGVFGLTLAVAPATVLIPRDIYEESIPEEYISIDEGGNEEEDEREIEEAKRDFKKVLKKMDDYSFRIFLPCHVATGWILDYEMPTEQGEYPMKWYIVTNAHVANKFRFAEDSYEKNLPTKALRKEADNKEFPDFRLTEGACDAGKSKEKDYFDFNLSKKKNGAEMRSNYGAIKNGKIKQPKLFYVPINFLEEDEAMGVKENNYRDFAVIEVEFKDLEYAKALTGDFYRDYQIGSEDALNLFARPLNERQSGEQIKESYDNFFSLGYSLTDGFSYEHNFDSEIGVASQLSDGNVKGHVSAPKFDAKNPEKMVKGGEKTLNSLGYFYSLQYRPMSGGASGGLVVDKDGNVLGIRSLGSSTTSLIVPLRSNKVIKDGVFVSPEYDLILGGGPSQKTSYRQAIEESGRTTYLSKGGGKHPGNSRMNATRSSCFGTSCFGR